MILDRIKEYIDYKGITVAAFERSIGMSNASFGKSLRNKGAIGTDKLENILSIYEDISPNWLLTGHGSMLKDGESPVATTEEQPQANEKSESASPLGNMVTRETAGAIPLVSEKAVGGFANEHFKIKERDVLAFYVVPSFRFLGVDFMIEVIGDSMVPRLCPGDIIACSIIRNSKFMQWNKCHLIATEEQGIIVKRLMPGDHEDELKAISDNKDYPPFAIPTDEITGIARVVGVIHLE